MPITVSKQPGHYQVTRESKGKVEKSFSYLENHFIAGASFEDFPDLQRKLKLFQDENNKRIHSVTKAQPVEPFEQEKLSLLHLPKTKYVGIMEDNRKVSYDCMMSYNGSRYSVPWIFAGKFVWIIISQGYYLRIYSQSNKLIAEHKLSLKKGCVVLDPSHFKNQKSLHSNFDVLKEKFLEEFPGTEMFIEKLKAQKRSRGANQLQQIIYLSKLYSKTDFIEAINKCIEYNIFNY